MLKDQNFNSQTIHPNKNFTIIQNDLIRSPKLSCKAYKLLCIGLSHSDKWVFNKENISKSFKEGIHTVKEAMKELRKLGYLHLKASRKGKNFTGHQWFWFADPISEEDFQKIYGQYDFRSLRNSDSPKTIPTLEDHSLRKQNIKENIYAKAYIQKKAVKPKVCAENYAPKGASDAVKKSKPVEKKIAFREKVLLKPSEVEKLKKFVISKLSVSKDSVSEFLERAYDVLNERKTIYNQDYISDYLALRKWVALKVKNDLNMESSKQEIKEKNLQFVKRLRDSLAKMQKRGCLSVQGDQVTDEVLKKSASIFNPKLKSFLPGWYDLKYNEEQDLQRIKNLNLQRFQEIKEHYARKEKFLKINFKDQKIINRESGDAISLYDDMCISKIYGWFESC
jgi:hypothetical protein